MWLKGRYYQQYERLDALAKCKACFEQAIELDPLFPQPYLGLAALSRAKAEYGAVRPKEAAAQGWAAIRRALELDDSVGEAYALSGVYRAWMDFDWKGAEADFARALVLAPTSESVHRLRAINCLVPTSRLDEAVQAMERAVELDPLSPLACSLLGKVLLLNREFERAQAAIETALELRPDYAIALWYRGAAMWYQGRSAEGVAWLQAAMQKIGTNPAMMGAIGMGLGVLGRTGEARAILAELEAAERERYVTPVVRAWVHLGLAELDAAFEWLDRAVEERDPHILDLPCKAIYDRLRSDPRFTALLRKMRLV